MIKSTFLLLTLVLLTILLTITPASVQPASAQVSSTTPTLHIFFSAGCADCWPYTEKVLIPVLEESGLKMIPEIHDYTRPEERKRMSDMIDEIELPRSIADSLYAFVPTDKGTLVVLGHVPAHLIQEALSAPDVPEKLVVWQPKMHGEPDEYRLWAWQGEVQTFSINTPFPQALEQVAVGVGPLPIGLANLNELLPAVIVTGLLDSVNPCAFAVILLLIPFLFTLRQSRNRVLQLGLVYIGMIFIVYFGIGLGILQAVRFSSDPHFVARAGSWLLIGLGVINLIEYFFPRFPIKLHMPASAGERSQELIKQASLPATVFAGLLVGLCTFPCSGGIYVSIITLLNAKTTLSWGLVYLFLYNLLFILPLVVILISLGNRTTAKRWARWERKYALKIRLWYGLAMVTLGVVMLFWII